MTLFFGLLGVVGLAASLRLAVAAGDQDRDEEKVLFGVLALVFAIGGAVSLLRAGQERAADILYQDGYAVELDAHGQSRIGVIAATPHWVESAVTPEAQR